MDPRTEEREQADERALCILEPSSSWTFSGNKRSIKSPRFRSTVRAYRLRNEHRAALRRRIFFARLEILGAEGRAPGNANWLQFKSRGKLWERREHENFAVHACQKPSRLVSFLNQPRFFYQNVVKTSLRRETSSPDFSLLFFLTLDWYPGWN